MKGQRMAVYAGVLTTALVAAVAGLAARADEALTSADAPREQRAEREQRRDRQVVVAPADRRVIQLDGRGSRLGVMVSDVDSETGSGVRIDQVEPGSAADKAGVKAGDVVVEFDGERVRSARQLTRLVQETPAGRVVPMAVRRGSGRETLDVAPEAREAFAWDGRLGPDLEREIERGVEQGLGDLPRRIGPFFDFRLDSMPSIGARGRLGVQVDPLTDQLAEYFGARDGGVLVASVTADSSAAQAGVKAGDVITKVNGATVQNPGDLIEALGGVKDGAAVTLDLVRDRKPISVTAKIQPERPRRPVRSARPA